MDSSKYTEKCLSCQPFKGAEVARTILYNEYCHVVLRTDDQNKWFGRCIAVPHKHISPFEKMSKENLPYTVACLQALDKIGRAMRNHYGITNINVMSIGNLTRDENGDKTSDIGYFHIHWHGLLRCGGESGKGGSVVRPYRTFTDDKYADALNINPKEGHVKMSADEDIIKLIKIDMQLALIMDGEVTPEEIIATDPCLEVLLALNETLKNEITL